MKNLEFLLFFISFSQCILHLILVYKIMESEKMINGFFDFLAKSNSAYPLMCNIIFNRKKINNRKLNNLFKINLFTVPLSFLMFIALIIKNEF